MAKPLSPEEGRKLTTAVETLNKVLRELHVAGHDYGVGVLGREPIAPMLSSQPDTRPPHMRMNPPRIYVKIVESATEVGREPSR